MSCVVYSIDVSTQKYNFFNVTEQLNAFLKKEHLYKDNISIIVRTPLKKNIYCKKSVFSFLNNSNTLGLIDILFTCDTKNYYLTVEIQSEGEYVAANRKIPRGTKIQESDLKILRGRLDILPNNIYRKKKDIINKVNLRDLFPFQPITFSMTRPFWIVKLNQQVTIIINGNNFQISSTAKALNNGSENENIRVKTKNGNIINGIVNKNGEVIVSL